MAEALSRSADYRVLRRLVLRQPYRSPAGCETRTAVLLDTETTGLDHARDLRLDPNPFVGDPLRVGLLVES